MKISSGDYEVFSSGHVNSFKSNPLRFDVLDDDSFIVSLHFDFDSKLTGSRIDIRARGIKEAVITMTNPTFGTGPSAPIPIGMINDKKAYFAFRVFVGGGEESSFGVSYTVFLGPEANG